MRDYPGEIKNTERQIFCTLGIALLWCVISQSYFPDSTGPLPPMRQADKLPPDFHVPKLAIPNSCFMSSMNLRGAYVAYCTARKYRYWAKLLLMEQISKSDPGVKLAHVVCVFEYFGRFYVYDVNHGVYMLTQKDIRGASAEAVASTVKQSESFTMGESLWVEEI